MELILDVIENLIHIYEEVFWLKELIITLQSLIVFVLVWWFVKLSIGRLLLIILSILLGIACTFFGDLGYWNDNDNLKHIAPATLYLLKRNENEDKKELLLAFLLPFFIISYEFYRSFFFVILSILIHLLIIGFIAGSKNNKYISVFISFAICVFYNYIGDIAEPGTNDLLANPVLITLAVFYIGFYKSDDKFMLFLKQFWIILLSFAYSGNWIFIFLKDHY